MIRVAVLGACGKMGQEVVKAVAAAGDMELAGASDVAHVGMPIGDLVGLPALNISVDADFEAMLNRAKPDVVVDFAKPFVMENTRQALKRGITPIIGTTGLSQAELMEIDGLAQGAGVSAMVIPNFAVGAVLMMKFAAEAAKYLPNVEIIELHHDKKVDAPSGTAIKTAEMIDEARKGAGALPDQPLGGDDAARGENRSGVQVHSVRLPGLVAHQEVLFGGTGQTLTIRHDSIDRTSFMPGVLLAIRRAGGVSGLVYGLDRLL